MIKIKKKIFKNQKPKGKPQDSAEKKSDKPKEQVPLKSIIEELPKR